MSELEAAVDKAVAVVVTQLDALTRVLDEVRDYPENNLINRLNLSNGAMARRIVGDLMAAGWTPPRVEVES